jgi:hypothetical protein
MKPGEQPDNLQPFDAEQFAQALFEEWPERAKTDKMYG